MAGRLIQAGSARFRLNQNSDINVTPFVDVMMVLLIVFMVALPVATVSIKVDLPQAGGGAAARPTYVSLQRGGALYIGDRPTTLEGLAADLAATVGGAHPTQAHIYVRADRGVTYGEFMAVVGQLHAGGFQSVGLVSEAI